MGHSGNIFGSFLMGIAVCLGARGGTGDSTRPPALGGICGDNIWVYIECDDLECIVSRTEPLYSIDQTSRKSGVVYIHNTRLVVLPSFGV